MTNLKEIVHQIGTATRKSDLMQTMQAAAGLLGFDVFSVTTRLVHIGGGAWRVMMSSLPKEFLAWYDQEQMADHDPLLLRSMESVSPFYADELDPAGIAKCSRAQAFIAQTAQCGLGASLSCVQHDQDGAATIATFFGRANPDDRDGTREQAAWIVAHLHDALERIVIRQLAAKRGPHGLLTRLERSMLELLARGYGAREVSRLLSVSPRSVRYYANRVREKLSAVSLNQAVSRAIESRQVSLSGAALPSHWSGVPKWIQVAEQRSGWSVPNPSPEMALREIRSAQDPDLLAQAVHRAAGTLGFQRFAFVLRTPDTASAQQLVLTNDPAAQASRVNPGELVRSCLLARSRPQCVPAFSDELPRAEPAAPPGITCATLGADGCSSALSMSGPIKLNGERDESRRACFRIARAAHERACVLAAVARPTLSDSDLSALNQMVGGLTIRNVAREQQKKVRTVRYRVAVVTRKLGARNSRHALAIATERGLLRREMGRLLSRELIRPFGTYTGPASP